MYIHACVLTGDNIKDTERDDLILRMIPEVPSCDK